jgi:hypothetical protein
MDIAADGHVLLCSEELRTEISGIDPSTGKERRGLEWINGSGLGAVSQDGKAILFDEWGGPAGPLYLVVYRKLDGSAPTSLGEGSTPRFSPHGTTVASPLLTRPPQLALYPVGTEESRRLTLGDIVNFTSVAWFPDGNRVLLEASKEGQPLRTSEMDLLGGKPQELGPADFTGLAVAKDGQNIAGRNGAGGSSGLESRDAESAIDSRHRTARPYRKMDQRWPSASGNHCDSMGRTDLSIGSGVGKENLAAESGIKRKGWIDIQHEGVLRRGQQDVCVR